jgi:hypothetical protein
MEMNDVSRELVRVFFELNGFLVNRDVSLLIRKPFSVKGSPGDFVLTVESIGKIQQAVVDVKPWHTEVFFPSVIGSSPEIFRFVEEDNLKKAAAFFDSKSFRKITVLPKLPAVKGTLKRSIAALKQSGIDHAIEFPTVLNYLISRVKTNINYDDSDLLQLIRIFKCYDFYASPQLELFPKK